MTTFLKHLPAIILAAIGIGAVTALGVEGTISGAETVTLFGTVLALTGTLLGVRIGATAVGATAAGPTPPAPQPVAARAPAVPVLAVAPPPAQQA